MHRYQTNINRILELLSGNNAPQHASNYDVARFESRIGSEFFLDVNKPTLLHAAAQHTKSICTQEPSCEKCYLCKYCEDYRLRKTTCRKDSQLCFADLFSGAGGFSLGFSQAGFLSVFAIDNQLCCTETYRFNHPEVPQEQILLKNIEDADSDITKLSTTEDVSVIIGGPPCQGFSTANRQRMIDDPRNKLYKHFVNAIERVQPAFFVMENVYGILKIATEIIEDFSALSVPYHVEHMVIDAVDFGIPQNRRRVFFIGTRLDLSISSIISSIEEEAAKYPKSLLQDALLGLRPLSAETKINSTTLDSESSGCIINLSFSEESSAFIDLINNNQKSALEFNHKARYNNARDIQIFSTLNQGDCSDDKKISSIMPYASRKDIFRDKYYRLCADKPCKTITAHMQYDCNMYIHPTQARGLTPREAARIQTYPDDYFFCGPYTKTYMQIGNSVPPLIAKTIANAIKAALLHYSSENTPDNRSSD